MRSSLAASALAARSAEEPPEERQESGPNEAQETQVLRPERVAEFIVWFVASPPEFVLTEGIIVPIEEGLP